MTRTIDIRLQTLTAEAFAPFGAIIGAPVGAPDFRQSHIESWRMPFASDGAIELMFARYRYQPMRCSRLERHINVTQSFIAMGGQSSVMVVAAPSPADLDASIPDPAAVRAFLVDGDHGIMLWRRTWHALTRFPAAPPGADFAMITEAETQAELQRQDQDSAPPRLTEVVDFEARFGIGFAVTDPDGLMDKIEP